MNSGATVQQYMSAWLTNQTEIGYDHANGTNYQELHYNLDTSGIGTKVKTTKVLDTNAAKMYINSNL